MMIDKYNTPPPSPLSFFYLQLPRPLLALPHPPLQALRIPDPEPNLKRHRIQRQRRLRGIAIQRVQDRMVPGIPRGHHAEGRDQPDERGVEFAVGEVRAGAHARAGAVGVVRGSAAVGGREVALRLEEVGVFEVGGVVVGGVGVLGLGEMLVFFYVYVCVCVWFGGLGGRPNGI